MVNSRATRLTRADLAGALHDIASSDRSVAIVLAACEAWESGYVASLLARAEELTQHDAVDAYVSPREQALAAIDRAIRHENPFLRVHRAGVHPSDEAVDAMVAVLHQQAHFHDVAAELERRSIRRTPPPGA